MTPDPDREKAAFLSAVPERDALHPRLRTLARLLVAAAASGQPPPNEVARRFALLAFTVAKDWVHYRSDIDRTGGEDIAGFTRPETPDDAVDALDRGEDDCDAKARLFVALCLAGHLPARIVQYWSRGVPRRLTHVSADVYLDGHWERAETTLERARLGELGERTPVEKDGKWLKP